MANFALFSLLHQYYTNRFTMPLQSESGHCYQKMLRNLVWHKDRTNSWGLCQRGNGSRDKGGYPINACRHVMGPSS
ncbi:hypothetical protein J6590_057780 [Homalodisca vitripennis]|nr:hypothetical protein J6590_057780 [Homalodisca vitripennis]